MYLIAQVAPLPIDPSDLERVAGVAFDGVTQGAWGLVAVAGVTLVVGLLREFGSQFWPVLGSRTAGPVLALVAASAGWLTTALLSGRPLTGTTFVQALVYGLGAVGLFSAQKNIRQQASQPKGIELPK